MITDFQDGYLAAATDDLLASLRKDHIQLILLTREMAAYPGLPEYCQETGGSYRLGRLDEAAGTIDSVLPESNLPVIPTQTHSNAEEAILICDQYLDSSLTWPVPVTKSIIALASTRKDSLNADVQKARRYLQFAQGNRIALVECAKEAAQIPNGPLGTRMLKRIEIPDADIPDKWKFVLQHESEWIFDDALQRWKLRQTVLSTAEPVSQSTPSHPP